MNCDGFGKAFEEKAEFNQYWYSPLTIQKIAQEVIQLNGKCAMLSTPSIYFSIPVESRNNCYLFDYDKGLSKDERFVFYDFNDPETIPEDLLGSFDLLVVDPPFITEEVWRKYAKSAHLLLKPETGKVILTTIAENEKLLFELFQATTTVSKQNSV